MIKPDLNSKQHGVVLITCLIFLILLLTLMRFTIGSAKMSEMKVGADFDEMSAQTATDYAFHDAELYIKRVDANGNSLQDSSLNLTDNENEIMKLALDYWEDSANFENIGGVYDGDTDPCTDQVCSNHVSAWEATCKNGNKGDFLCYRASKNDKIKASQGKYVIERFMPSNNKINISLAGTKTRVVIFRVTAKGYSQPAGGNATSVMRQNTYVLTYDPTT